MIRARFYENSRHELCGFSIDGHAGFDEYGFDIICSAVSALATNTANSIEALTGEPMEVESSDGHLRVMVLSLQNGQSCEKAELFLQSLKLGLESVIESYGSEYLQLSINQN